MLLQRKKDVFKIETNMKKSYELTGMTGSGCVSNVKKALLQVPGVTVAEVQFYSQSAVVTMNRLIDVVELQTYFPKAGRYSIKEIA